MGRALIGNFKGPKGEKGDTGPQGPIGATGATGVQGEKGDTGGTGPQGPKGDKGDTGATGPAGNLNTSVAEFTEASIRENINSGESGSTIFGKIKKWFADLKGAAFCDVSNDLVTTVANRVLDARQGKALDDKIAELNRNIKTKVYTDSYTPNGLTVTARLSGNTVTIKILGTAAQTLGTQDTYAACGTIKELKSLFTGQESVIKYTLVNPVISGQVMLQYGTGIVFIGITRDTSGNLCSIPKGYGIYIEETFVL